MQSTFFSKQNKKPRYSVCSKCMRSTCNCSSHNDQDYMLSILDKNRSRVKRGLFDVSFSEPYSYSDDLTGQKTEYDVNFKDFSEQLFSKGKPAKLKGRIPEKPKSRQQQKTIISNQKNTKKLAVQQKLINRGQVKKPVVKPYKKQKWNPVLAKQQRKQAERQQKQIKTQFGGFKTKADQDKALASAIQGQLQTTPEQFPEVYQKTLVGKGLITQAQDDQFDTTESYPLTASGRTNLQSDDNYARSFEALYPKQTAQLIKMGVDLSYFGQKVGEIDDRLARHDTKIKYFDDKVGYFQNMKEDHDQKLTDLGKSVGDASKGSVFGQILGGSSLLVIGVIAVGLILVLRSK